MPAINDPASEHSDPVAVVRQVALWDQVMVDLHSERPRQRGVEPEAVHGPLADAAARAVRIRRAAALEVGAAPPDRRIAQFRGRMEVGVDDVLEPAYRRLVCRIRLQAARRRQALRVEMGDLLVAAREQLPVVLVRSDRDVVVEPERMGHLHVATGTPKRDARAVAPEARPLALRITHARDRVRPALSPGAPRSLGQVAESSTGVTDRVAGAEDRFPRADRALLPLAEPTLVRLRIVGDHARDGDDRRLELVTGVENRRPLHLAPGCELAAAHGIRPRLFLVPAI